MCSCVHKRVCCYPSQASAPVPLLPGLLTVVKLTLATILVLRNQTLYHLSFSWGQGMVWKRKEKNKSSKEYPIWRHCIITSCRKIPRPVFGLVPATCANTGGHQTRDILRYQGNNVLGSVSCYAYEGVEYLTSIIILSGYYATKGLTPKLTTRIVARQCLLYGTCIVCEV